MSQFRDELAAASRRLGASGPPELPLAESGGVASASRRADAPGGGVTARQPSRNGRLAWMTAVVLAALAAVVVVGLLSARDDNRRQLAPVATPSSATVDAATPSSIASTPSTGAEPATESRPPVTPAASIATSIAPVVTTAPDVATAPVAATTTPPASAEDSASLSPAQAEGLLRDYYAMVAAGDYATSWSQLAPEFQRGKARSFEYYAQFWDENDVEIGDIELVVADAQQAIVHVDLRWNVSDSWVTDEFTLRRDGDAWLIAGQTTVDS